MSGITTTISTSGRVTVSMNFSQKELQRIRKALTNYADPTTAALMRKINVAEQMGNMAQEITHAPGEGIDPDALEREMQEEGEQ